MPSKITQLQPESIWKHFYNLTQIPRPSGHEAAAIEYIRQFSQQTGLQYKIDNLGNIIVQKPAFKGRETAPAIILQTHVDMVPQKNSDKQHNFETDPIEAVIEGDWVRANKTTLGADNGIGVAATLAILESDTISHGPLEALFTVSEETGMDGAFGLRKDALKGDILINLDSEDEGELFIGCAGGVNATVEWIYTPVKSAQRDFYKIHVTGLKGGHSGVDIHLGRANANILLAELLTEIQKTCTVQLATFQGGNLRNAIPREAEAIVVIKELDKEKCVNAIESCKQKFVQQYQGIEESIAVSFDKSGAVERVMDSSAQTDFLKLICTCPNGVIKMSSVISGVVQTSNNLSVVKASGGKCELLMLIRSSVDSDRTELGRQIEKHFSAVGANTTLSGDYPGWQPDANSEILKKAKDTYQKLTGKIPEVKVIHAGLECGIIGGKFPGLDMISFGPTIRYPHSPDEKVNIGSVSMFWKYLIQLLESV